MPNETEDEQRPGPTPRSLPTQEPPHPVIDHISGSHDDNIVTPPRVPFRRPNTPAKATPAEAIRNSISRSKALIGSFGKAIKALRSPSSFDSTAATLNDALEAIKERRSRGDEVNETERELLYQLMMHVDPGTNHEKPNVVGIGQREYVRLPPQNDPRKSRSVRQNAKVVALVADRSTSSTPSAVLTKAFKSCDEGAGSKALICLRRPTKEQRISNTLEFRRVGKMRGWNSCDEARKFVEYMILDKQLRVMADQGVIRHHLNEQAPRELYYHGSDEFEFGEGNKKGKGRKALKRCPFFIVCHPDELLAMHIQQIRESGQFLYSPEFCFGNNQIIVLVLNIDKAVSETTYMARILNQPDCNQARKCMLLGQVRNGADESRYNVHKILRKLPGGLEQDIRATIKNNDLGQPNSYGLNQLVESQPSNRRRCVCGATHEFGIVELTCVACLKKYWNSEHCIGPPLSRQQGWRCFDCGGPSPTAPPTNREGEEEQEEIVVSSTAGRRRRGGQSDHCRPAQPATNTSTAALCDDSDSDDVSNRGSALTSERPSSGEAMIPRPSSAANGVKSCSKPASRPDYTFFSDEIQVDGKIRGRGTCLSFCFLGCFWTALHPRS